MIDALAGAINEFGGGVVLVSHDMRLVQKVVKQIYEVDNGKVTLFPGDIAAYKAMLTRRLIKMDEDNAKRGSKKR